MNNKDQTEFLFKLLGLTDDLQSYDESRQVAYNERRDVNRDLSKAHAKLESHEIYEEVPDVPDYNDIVKNLNQARYHNQTLIDAKSSLDEHVKNIEVLNKNINDRKVRIKSDIEELKDKIKRLKAELDEGWKDIDDAIEHNKHEIDECREYIETFEEADVSKWENKLGEINELTKKATDAKEYFELKDEAEKLTKESQSFTSEIEAIDQDKEEFVKSIDMPVDGMTIERETNNILYEGNAVKDLSMSESIIFWSKVYLSTNPELRMMTLDNGESLDSEAKQKLNDFAKENNLLYIVTVVDESGNNGIVIEDGQIKENNYEK